jgi:hypothetical protein
MFSFPVIFAPYYPLYYAPYYPSDDYGGWQTPEPAAPQVWYYCNLATGYHPLTSSLAAPAGTKCRPRHHHRTLPSHSGISAASYAQLGEDDALRSAAAEIMWLRTDFAVAMYTSHESFKLEADREPSRAACARRAGPRSLASTNLDVLLSLRELLQGDGVVYDDLHGLQAQATKMAGSPSSACLGSENLKPQTRPALQARLLQARTKIACLLHAGKSERAKTPVGLAGDVSLRNGGFPPAQNVRYEFA